MKNVTDTQKDELFKTIEKLTPFFQKVYFFNKLHRMRKYPVVTPIGKEKGFQLGQHVFLGSGDFPLLWLIKNLIESSYKKSISISIGDKTSSVECCDKIFINQLFLWRRPHSDKETSDKINHKFERRLKRLRASGLIDYTPDPGNRQKNLIYLTGEGKKCLQELQEERSQILARIFEVGKIQPHELDRILKEFGSLAEATWEIVTTEAKSIKVKI